VAQSVELLLDPASEARVHQEWAALHEAGLPSELRPHPDGSHRPHLTLFAGSAIRSETDAALSLAVAELRMCVQLGTLMVFGPSRQRWILVHAVVPTYALLELQQHVAKLCGADDSATFAAGRWTPHITVARRLGSADVGAALEILGPLRVSNELALITRCRRWDGTARRSWLL